MIVLITGASGFIGSRLAAALADVGYEVICAVRTVPSASDSGERVRHIAVDFQRDQTEDVWLPRVRGVDVVINAAGIIREGRGQRFQAVHTVGPIALFAACARAGVRRVIQISALGADERAATDFLVSKREADSYLQSLSLDWVIVQPSLVYGPGGTSAQLFEALASAPLVPLPGDGNQRVQPVHVEDVISGILALLPPSAPARAVIAFVGPESLTLRHYLEELRKALGPGRAVFVPIPRAIVRLAARIGQWMGRGLLDRDTLSMLERGSTADVTAFSRLLGRAPRPVSQFVPAEHAASVSAAARVRGMLPVVRWSLALVWIAEGLFSFGVYPVEKSFELLAAVGVEGRLAPVALYGAASLDLALGVATLTVPSRRLWSLQMLVVLAYTAILSIWLPRLWLEPFGPLLKNVPILALLWLLHRMDRR